MAATAENIAVEKSDPAKDMLLRNSVDVLRAFMECSNEIQNGILEMAQILNNDSATEDEKAAAADTLIEALYPKYAGEELGIDSAEYEAIHKAQEPEIEKELDEAEAKFASSLLSLMEKKGVTQKDLAEAIGVGQPAISMMLSRECRPQRRTLEKIAKSLDVPVKSLWPNAK